MINTPLRCRSGNRGNQRTGVGNGLFIVELKVGEEWVMIDAFNTLKFVVEELPSGESTIRITGKKDVRKAQSSY